MASSKFVFLRMKCRVNCITCWCYHCLLCCINVHVSGHVPFVTINNLHHSVAHALPNSLCEIVENTLGWTMQNGLMPIAALSNGNDQRMSACVLLMACVSAVFRLSVGMFMVCYAGRPLVGASCLPLWYMLKTLASLPCVSPCAPWIGAGEALHVRLAPRATKEFQGVDCTR